MPEDESTFHLEIMDMEHKWVDGEVASLRLPTVDGELGILAHHEPMRLLLAPGVLTVRALNQRETTYFVSGGVVEVLNNRVRICADKWMHEEEMLAGSLPHDWSTHAKSRELQKQLDRLLAQLRAKSLKPYSDESAPLKPTPA